MLFSPRKEQKAPFSTRVLDRKHHEYLDKLPEIDLTRYRLQGLDHSSEIQSLDGGIYRSCRAMWRLVYEHRVEPFELLYLAASAPTEIALACVSQAIVANRVEAPI